MTALSTLSMNVPFMPRRLELIGKSFVADVTGPCIRFGVRFFSFTMILLNFCCALLFVEFFHVRGAIKFISKLSVANWANERIYQWG